MEISLDCMTIFCLSSPFSIPCLSRLTTWQRWRLPRPSTALLRHHSRNEHNTVYTSAVHIHRQEGGYINSLRLCLRVYVFFFLHVMMLRNTDMATVCVLTYASPSWRGFINADEAKNCKPFWTRQSDQTFCPLISVRSRNYSTQPILLCSVQF